MGYGGSVRFQGADGEGRGAPNGLTAYAAAISLTRACQRATNSRRCSGSGTWAPPRQRIRKYCRSSSNAARENRAADSKRPKPSIATLLVIALLDGAMVLLGEVVQILATPVEHPSPQDPADRFAVGRVMVRRDA